MKWIKVKKKPIVVSAFQLTNSMTTSAELDDIPQVKGYLDNFNEIFFVIKTLEGKISARVGDYIIKGIKGELYPCRKDIFEESYEVIE